MKILVKILTSFIEIFVEFEIYDFQYLLTRRILKHSINVDKLTSSH
jgi:hypothetical protein